MPDEQPTRTLTNDVYRCGHCGASARMLVLARGTEDKAYALIRDKEQHRIETHAALLCPICSHIIVIKREGAYTLWLPEDLESTEPANWEVGEINYLLPTVRFGTGNVPKAVLNPFLEADKLRHFSPPAALMLARKTLEAICSDQKLPGNNLERQVRSLINSDLVPKSFARVIDRIRIAGNAAAHDHDPDYAVSAEDAALLINLAAAVIDYLYESPALVRRVEDNLKPKQAQGS